MSKCAQSKSKPIVDSSAMSGFAGRTPSYFTYAAILCCWRRLRARVCSLKTLEVLALRSELADKACKGAQERWEELLPAFAASNLKTARAMPEIADVIRGRLREIAINLDQDVNVQPHYGKNMPCILASISFMWVMCRGRLLTAKDQRG